MNRTGNKAQVKPLVALLTVLIVMITVFAFYGHLHGLVDQAFNSLFSLFRTTTEDARAMRSAEALRYAINCEAYIGAGAAGKYRKNCWAAAVEGDPWLSGSSYQPGQGRNFGQGATVYCFPPGSNQEKVSEVLRLEKDNKGFENYRVESYLSSCVVENFKLPQNLQREDKGPLRTIADVVTGNTGLTPEDWFKGFGDPQYLLYYGSFPRGEEQDWQLDEMTSSRMAIIISSLSAAATNILFEAARPVVSKAYDGATGVARFIKNKVKGTARRALRDPLQSALLRLARRRGDDALYRAVRSLSDNIDDLVSRKEDDVLRQARRRVIDQIDDQADESVDTWDDVVRVKKSHGLSEDEAYDKLERMVDDEFDELLESGDILLRNNELADYLDQNAANTLVDKYEALLDTEKQLYRQGLSEDEMADELRKKVDDEIIHFFREADDEVLKQLKRSKLADDVAQASQSIYDPTTRELVDDPVSELKEVLTDEEVYGFDDTQETHKLAERIVEKMKRNLDRDDMYQQVRKVAYEQGVDLDLEDYGIKALRRDMANDAMQANGFSRNPIVRTWDGAHRTYHRTEQMVIDLSKAVKRGVYDRTLRRVVRFPVWTLHRAVPDKAQRIVAERLWPLIVRLYRTRAFQVEVLNLIDREFEVPPWAKRTVVMRHCHKGLGRLSGVGIPTRMATQAGRWITCYVATGVGFNSVKVDSMTSKFMPAQVNSIMLSKTAIDYGRVGKEAFGKSNRMELNDYAKYYTIRLNKGKNPSSRTKIRFYAASPCHANVIVKNMTDTCQMDLLTGDQVRKRYPKSSIRDAIERDGTVYFSTQPIFSFGQPSEARLRGEEWNSAVQMGNVSHSRLFERKIKTYFERKIKNKCIKQALGVDSLRQYNPEKAGDFGCGSKDEKFDRRLKPLDCALAEEQGEDGTSNYRTFELCVASELDESKRQKLQGTEIGTKDCGKTPWLSSVDRALEKNWFTKWTGLEKITTPFSPPDYKQSEVETLSVTFQPYGTTKWEDGEHNYCYAINPLNERASYWAVFGGSVAAENLVAMGIGYFTGGTGYMVAESISGSIFAALEQAAIPKIKKMQSWPNR